MGFIPRFTPESFRKKKSLTAQRSRLKLWLSADEDNVNDDRCKALEDKFTPIVRELLLPDTLCPSEPKTVQEHYLGSLSS